jgi:hypothetical protein
MIFTKFRDIYEERTDKNVKILKKYANHERITSKTTTIDVKE